MCIGVAISTGRNVAADQRAPVIIPAVKIAPEVCEHHGAVNGGIRDSVHRSLIHVECSDGQTFDIRSN